MTKQIFFTNRNRRRRLRDMPGQDKSERVEKAQILPRVHRRALQASQKVPNMPTSVRSHRR